MVMFSCTKEDTETIDSPIDPADTVTYSPTPYTVAIPDWVTVSGIIGEMPIPEDNPMTVEGIALGRELFYEKMLSGDETMSCASCHFQEFNFSDSARFSTGITGDIGDRQAMGIVNSAWLDSLFWDGRAITLEDQAFGPVVNPVELNESWVNVEAKLQADPKYPSLFKKAFGTKTIDSVLVSKAISQFERTMVSYDSKYDEFLNVSSDVYTETETNGYMVFLNEAHCIHCHSGPLMTDDTFRNNGLDEVFTDIGLAKTTGLVTDEGKFKVTTLRNIAESGPYMHDGRFATLEEVIEHYDNGVNPNSPNIDVEMVEDFGGGLNLTEEQKSDLLAFLKTLTDDSFLANEDFSDPNN
ncbi:MAG: cytochrome-c peroxidase [Bacteroidetes bacterium]|nr:MAG: cytochrome-c peroxidase [Bacteroidota bacterium]